MNWLQKNPVGVALAGFCAVLLLVAGALAFIWSGPASSGVEAISGDNLVNTAVSSPSNDLGPISQYKLVTDRPVFEETRRPVVSVEVDDPTEGLEEQRVAGTPEVSLSGVVITDEKSIVTLKPVNGGETIIAIEGQPLGEDYPGWAVTDIKPRKIVLNSLDGDSLELDLAINTRPMAEPPKPEPPPAAEGEQASGEADSEEPPLSRAEEIRQRIAERREELRRQAEENEQDEAQKMRSQYQNAIQNMIKRKDDSDETTKERDDGNGN